MTEWPVDGIDVAWDSTNATAGWELSAVLVNGTDANTDTDFSSKFNLRTLVSEQGSKQLPLEYLPTYLPLLSGVVWRVYIFFTNNGNHMFLVRT